MSLSSALRRAARTVLTPVPQHLARNHRSIGADAFDSIRRALREHYHVGWRAESKYSAEGYRRDVQEHLTERLESDRRIVVPWLEAAAPLRGRRILEIGCGTGASTVALGEQGAAVTAVDIDEGAVAVAKARCRTYGVDAEFAVMNAENLTRELAAGSFDTIIFFACLEHMTIAERLRSLADGWSLLPSGGQLAVIDTPNRLWFFDAHTSMLPFFHWLPNELAFRYSKFSPRENFRELYADYAPESKEHFLRRGRGVSFHEIDLAIGDVRGLDVVSSLDSHFGLRSSLRRLGRARRFKSLLMAAQPGVHEGFFDENLNIIIRKR
jgi:2-polyprenyl-3-methyl-5-hydroxy-6-metoxy-1,4-benzoquinol methylase